MDFLHENATIGSLVTKMPQYASIFEKLGLDYCCKGNKTLKELCEEKKMNVAEVLQKLKQVPESDVVVNWSQLSLEEIIEHIVSTHHAYAKQELPRISQLLKKVHSKHGHRYPYLAELQNIFEEMKEPLLEHMEEEEKIVFPLIIKLATNKASSQEEIKEYLHSLDQDHLETGAALEKMKNLTNGYTPPSDACMTHMVMLNSLAHLEQNMHEHIHKENQVLFPRMMTH